MTARINHNAVGIMLAGGFFIGLWSNECLGSQKCKKNSGETKQVCVAWNREAAPVEYTDFEVSYACQGCSDAPAVDLKTGDDYWVVWSEVISTGAAANIGSLSTTDSNNYTVKIANGANAGAANVGSMLLLPGGGASSSIDSGSRISGNLTGNLTVQKSSGGSGGAVSMTIGGDVEGDMTIPVVSSLTVSGNVGSGAAITIGEIDGTGYVVNLTGYNGEFAGDLTLQNGIDSGQYVSIIGELTGSVDCGQNAVAGTLAIAGGASANATVTAGAVTGWVGLGEDATFSGTATFASVAYAHDVKACFSDVAGTIHITGDVYGNIWISGSDQAGGGDLLAGASIQIDGEMGPGSRINVLGDIAGDVSVGGDVAGEILAGSYAGDLDGDVDIDGVMTGNICADNLSAAAGLPGNIDIFSFGPYWTICGEYGCICDAASCAGKDCNSNEVLDICEILDGTYEDCDGDNIPDAGGSCDPTNQDAVLSTSNPENEDT